MRFNHTSLICVLFVLLSAGAVFAMPYTIVDAARRGDDHAVRKLLGGDPGLALEKDALGYTSLDWACTRGHWIIVGHLLDAGAPVNSAGGDGGTAMHKACHHGRADMIQLLLSAGGDLSVANQWGRVPLHVSVRRGHADVVRLLLDHGADIHAVTREGWTPLHVAHMAGQPSIVELLLSLEADSDRKDNEGRKPSEMTMTRPVALPTDAVSLDQYQGLYDLGGGFEFKVWLDDGSLRIREFAPDRLYPTGEDEFFCDQEPWRVQFNRNESGRIESMDVDFLRRTVRGQKRMQALYTGSQECRNCHGGGEAGNQYISWIRSGHAGAYWRLATDWARLLPSFRPPYRDITDPITEDRCLLCHTTVAQDPDALRTGTYRIEEGVGCEMCHGPGSLYMDPDIMSDREKFLAGGGIVPGEETCRRCHRNPDRFDFATWWPKIRHAGGEPE